MSLFYVLSSLVTVYFFFKKYTVRIYSFSLYFFAVLNLLFSAPCNPLAGIQERRQAGLLQCRVPCAVPLSTLPSAASCSDDHELMWGRNDSQYVDSRKNPFERSHPHPVMIYKKWFVFIK